MSEELTDEEIQKAMDKVEFETPKHPFKGCENIENPKCVKEFIERAEEMAENVLRAYGLTDEELKELKENTRKWVLE